MISLISMFSLEEKYWGKIFRERQQNTNSCFIVIWKKNRLLRKTVFVKNTSSRKMCSHCVQTGFHDWRCSVKCNSYYIRMGGQKCLPIFFVKNLIFIMNGKIFKQGIGGFEMNMILTILKLIIIPYFLYCLYTVFIFFLTLILSIIVMFIDLEDDIKNRMNNIKNGRERSIK